MKRIPSLGVWGGGKLFALIVAPLRIVNLFKGPSIRKMSKINYAICYIFKIALILMP